MWKTKLIRDRKYLDSYRAAACYACGAHDGTVVGAHIRAGFFGLGVKPGDDMTLPLCAECHARQGAGEAAFWGRIYVTKPDEGVALAKTVARIRYLKWKDKQK